jgi:hypothetical protein
MEDFSNPIVGNCFANSSTSVLKLLISAWTSGSESTAALKSFSFGPADQEYKFSNMNNNNPTSDIGPVGMTCSEFKQFRRDLSHLRHS